MVISSVIKWLGLGLVGAFALSALIDPARASGTVSAFGGIGSALGSLGTGVQSLLTGIGIGSSKLLNPLWTLRDLIYGPQAGVQTPLDIQQSISTGNLPIQNIPNEMESIQLDPNAPYTPLSTGVCVNCPPKPTSVAPQKPLQFGGVDTSYGWGFNQSSQVVINPFSGLPSRITNAGGADLSSLEGQTLAGILQSSVNDQTIVSNNAGAAGSNSSQSSSFSSGAAQAAGYSTGKPSSQLSRQ